MKSSYMKVY